MRIWKLVGIALALTGAASAQETTRRPARFDVSWFAGRYDLDKIEFDHNGNLGSGDAEVERRRVGFRAAFGPERLRGFFQLFVEELDGEGFGNQSYDAFGFGGGVRGAQRLNRKDAEVALLIPFQADVSLVIGNDDPSGVDETLVYSELQSFVGFGIDWRGLRPVVGIQGSLLAGIDALDIDLDGDGDDDEFDLTAANAGAFFEIGYKHPKFPLYGRFHAGGGDFQAAEFVIGASW